MGIYKQEILPSRAGCSSPMGNILPAVRKWKHGYLQKKKRSYPLEPVVLVPWATLYQLSGSGSMGIYKQKRSYPLEPVVLVPWATFYQLSGGGSMDIYKQEILPSRAGCSSPMGNILPAVRKWKHGYLQTKEILPSRAGCSSPMGNILPAVRKWEHGYLQTRDLTL